MKLLTRIYGFGFEYYSSRRFTFKFHSTVRKTSSNVGLFLYGTRFLAISNLKVCSKSRYPLIDCHLIVTGSCGQGAAGVPELPTHVRGRSINR